MSLGEAFSLAMGYWYYWLPILGLLGFVGVWLVTRNQKKSRKKEALKLVDAIIFDEHQRRIHTTIPASEIENFDSLLPKLYKGKRVYYLEPVTVAVPMEAKPTEARKTKKRKNTRKAKPPKGEKVADTSRS